MNCLTQLTHWHPCDKEEKLSNAKLFFLNISQRVFKFSKKDNNVLLKYLFANSNQQTCSFENTRQVAKPTTKTCL